MGGIIELLNVYPCIILEATLQWIETKLMTESEIRAIDITHKINDTNLRW